ncbi:unnamed protein product [Timema podura]|uniref:inositol-phosphate phosphatase n=1 Tax=Timema podura TaxID=61482 RepID=A0ABN7NHY0_TIMPD|nr:unnamed protein product [Timema podura]
MNFGGTIRLNRIGVCIIIGVFVLFLLYMSSNSSGGDAKVPVVKDVSDNNSINLRKLLIAAIQVAEKGGKEVVAVKKDNNLDEKTKGKTKEGVNDPVTKADYKSHCVMYYSLKHWFPTLKVISEEHSSEKDCSNLLFLDLDLNPNTVTSSSISLPDEMIPPEDITVWIDPLDATKEYTGMKHNLGIENLLEYVTTMVCVAVKGKPIIGVVHKPFGVEPKTSWAWFAVAHTPNLKPINEAIKNISEQAFGKNVEVISAAGAGYKSLEVATGNVTAYIHTTAIKKWDVCAGNAIVESLGGKMTTLTNEQLNYSDTNVVNEKGLLATMAKHDWYLNRLSPSKVKV